MAGFLVNDKPPEAQGLTTIPQAASQSVWAGLSRGLSDSWGQRRLGLESPVISPSVTLRSDASAEMAGAVGTGRASPLRCGLSAWLAWASSQHGRFRVAGFLQDGQLPLE